MSVRLGPRLTEARIWGAPCASARPRPGTAPPRAQGTTCPGVLGCGSGLQPVGCTQGSWGRAGALPDPAALPALPGGHQALTVPQDW